MKIPSLSLFAVACAIQGSSFAQMMTAREFNELPVDDRRTVLLGVLTKRDDAVRNIRAKSATHMYNVHYKDGKRGKLKKEVARYECELRRKDGNHWASINWFRADEKSPTIKVLTTIDADSGEARSVARHRKLNGVFGSITTEEDTTIRCCDFAYWFDATYDEPQAFPLNFLQEHANDLEFAKTSGEDEGLIEVSLLYTRSTGTPYQNNRTLWLDPQKGFLPTRMFVRWEYELKEPFFQEVETDFHEYKEIDGVWFPTHFTSGVVIASSEQDGFSTIRETTVQLIELGGVEDGDLAVIFEDGTQVQDRLKGVLFKAGESIQEAPPPVDLKSTGRNFRFWIVVANLMVLAVVIGFFVRNHFRKKPGNTTVA